MATVQRIGKLECAVKGAIGVGEEEEQVQRLVYMKAPAIPWSRPSNFHVLLSLLKGREGSLLKRELFLIRNAFSEIEID